MGDPRPLVVMLEDDHASAEALGFVLRDWGADVAHATSLPAIAETLGERIAAIDCIIADFNLGPGPDGVALATALRDRSPTARVLVLSGSFHGQAQAAAHAAGFPMIQKPAQADAIIAWLEAR